MTSPYTSELPNVSYAGESIIFTDNPLDPSDPLVHRARARPADGGQPDPYETYRGLLARCWHDAMTELDEIDRIHGIDTAGHVSLEDDDG